MVELAEKSTDEELIGVIEQAIAIAPSKPIEALTTEVYRALAVLSVKPKTSGVYQVLLSKLADTHKAFSKTDIRKQVEANVPVLVTPESQVRDEIALGVEPWESQVDGDRLAEAIKTRIDDYCVLPEGASDSIALWVMASYSIDAFRLFPKLLITSPQPRCGKSTLLEIIGALVSRPLTGSNISASVIFRAVQAWGVSILMDEADTYIHNNEALRGIINSGHTKSTAFVWRVEGDNNSLGPVRFSTWSPMVIAMIKTPADTILDRSIWCQLERKNADDKVKRLPRDIIGDCLDLRRQCQRWADDNSETLAMSDPEMPQSTNDRAEDNFRTLAAVADNIGGSWPCRLREAYQQSVLKQSSLLTDDLAVELLLDLREVMEASPEDKVYSSSQLVKKLNQLQDRPWSTVTGGGALTAYRLSKLLKPFGVEPGIKNLKGLQFRGYSAAQLKDICDRYAPQQQVDPTGDNHQGIRVSGSSSEQQKSRTPADSKGVSGCVHEVDALTPSNVKEKDGVRLNGYSDGLADGLTPG